MPRGTQWLNARGGVLGGAIANNHNLDRSPPQGNFQSAQVNQGEGNLPGLDDGSQVHPDERTQHANEAPQSPSDSTEMFTIYIHNLELDNYEAFNSALEACSAEIYENGVRWRQTIRRLRPTLQDMCSEKCTRDAGSRSTFTRLFETLRNISTLSEDLDEAIELLPDSIYQSPVALEMEARGRYDDIPIDGLAWSCMFWIWGTYKTYFKSVVDYIRPLLITWDAWVWQTPAAREDGLRLLSFLVERRLRCLPAGLLRPGRFVDSFRRSMPEAADWLYYYEERRLRRTSGGGMQDGSFVLQTRDLLRDRRFAEAMRRRGGGSTPGGW